jgi:hypothetical protein
MSLPAHGLPVAPWGLWERVLTSSPGIPQLALPPPAHAPAPVALALLLGSLGFALLPPHFAGVPAVNLDVPRQDMAAPHWAYCCVLGQRPSPLDGRTVGTEPCKTHQLVNTENLSASPGLEYQQ